MGGVINAERQFVAQIGPGGFWRKLETQAFLAVEIFGARDQQQAGVGEGHEADAKLAGHLKNSAAVMSERAMSAIFLPSFIATLRIIA